MAGKRLIAVAGTLLAATAVATTPAGSCSRTVADVPDGAPPVLPMPMVYCMVPLVFTADVAVFEMMKFAVSAPIPRIASDASG